MKLVSLDYFGIHSFFLNKGTSSNSWQSQLISVNVDEKAAATTTNNSNNMEQTMRAKDEAIDKLVIRLSRTVFY